MSIKPVQTNSEPTIKLVSIPVVSAAPADVVDPVADTAPVVEAPAAPSGEERYEVLADTPFPRRGAPTILRKGKVLSSSGYDIGSLIAMGLPLRKL